MSSSNENNHSGGDNTNNTSTTNIFGSSTKSSISSLFGASTDSNQQDKTEQHSELNQPSTTSDGAVSSSTSQKFEHRDNSAEGAYDLFGTMGTTKTTVFGTKESETLNDLSGFGETNAAGVSPPKDAVDDETSFVSGDQTNKDESGKPLGVFGKSDGFGVSTFDAAKTSNLFADTHFTRASELLMQSQHKEPPVLHTHIEKPNEAQHLDLSKLTESDFGEGYDSNLYSVEDRDDEKLNKQKEQLYGESKLKAEDSSLFSKPKEPETSSLFATPDPMKTTTELFGPPDKALKSFETFGSGEKSATSLFGQTEPKTVTLGSVTAPTFNLVETDQTHKVTESSLSSKTESLTTSLTEPGDSKPSLFGSTKSNLFGDLSKPATFGTDDNKLLAPSSGTSLFGSTDNKSTNLFGSTTTTNLFGTPDQSSTTTSLFGSADTSKAGGLFGSTTTSTGLFGAQDKAADTTTKTGTTDLFGSAQKTDNLFGSTTTTTGGLFGSTDTSKTGGLFGSTTPATTNLFATTDATTTANLFGTTDKTSTTTTNLFATSQPSTTGGLFGSTDTTNKTGGLFGSTDTTTTTGGLFASTTAPATTGLFATNDKPATTTGGLFGATESTTSGPLFGSTDTGSSPPKDLFGKTDKPTTGGLFGAPDTSGPLMGQADTGSKTGLFATDAGKAPLFGTDSGKTGDLLGQTDSLKPKEEPTKTTSTLGVTQTPYAGTQDTTKLDVDFSVTEQHTIAELLDSWEKRVAKKVESFNLFSDKVATIDRQIVQQCNNINSLLTMHKELLEKHKKMEASIKTMEEEQKMALSVLDNMERVLKGKLETLNNRSNGYNMVQAITRNLQELSDQLSTTTKVAEDTAEACQPEPLYTIAKVLSFHQVSLIDLEKQCDEIDRRIKALNPSLTL
eukprot:XP_764926.1 sporozoite and macroschizont protein 1 [Theileria parva strain Muguga]